MKKFLFAIPLLFLSCSHAGDNLYEYFQNPEDSCKVFVRWWWNGNKLDKEEITRELDMMKEAGIGGVEINPIAFPSSASDPDRIEEIEWLSDKWLDMVEHTLSEAKAKGIICDMIIGSGWPFGGEFVPEKYRTQMVTIDALELKGGRNYSLSISSILDNVNPDFHSKYANVKKDMLAAYLVPENCTSLDSNVVIKGSAVKNGILEIDVPEGNYVLFPIVRLTGFMAVINGAEGAKGPVMNHYSAEATSFYVSRLVSALKKRFGNDLSPWLRALFVDSIELEGANWCDDMVEEFNSRRGYDITPFLPFILNQVGEMGNSTGNGMNMSVLSDSLKNIVSLVRYDFELTKTELFKERFTDVVKNACHDIGVRFRMQPYGRGLYPVESSMYVDIPETETWHNLTIGRNMPEFGKKNAYYYNGANTEYSRQGRAYTIANKFVSSGAHFAGKKLISCEELTNTEMLFNASMNDIKLIGDQSNLTGVTHSVLHGYNYSPANAPFPGWVQYGTFINERNPWWPYFRYWTEYKARLSSVFVNSEMKAEIAILHPIADLWKKYGAQRDPFPVEYYPAYAHALWEAVHQNGASCDYISEGIIKSSDFQDGYLCYNGRKYSTLILMNVESLDLQTMEGIKDFVECGGKVICIDTVPDKSDGYLDYEENSQKIKEISDMLLRNFSRRFIKTEYPTKPLNLWYKALAKKENLPAYLGIEEPNNFVSQIPYKYGDKDIYFICNMNSTQYYDLNVDFKSGGKTIWLWDPETGCRKALKNDDGIISMTIAPSQSLLFVIDNEKSSSESDLNFIKPSEGMEAAGQQWKIRLEHVDGHVEEFCTEELFDLSLCDKYRSFAGTIVYESILPFDIDLIDLGYVNGISEVMLNGKSVGIKWYGRHIYDVSTNADNKGELKIIVKSTLGNYIKSTDSPVSRQWMKASAYYPCGLTSDIKVRRRE